MADPMIIPVAFAAIVAFASMMGIVWILVFTPASRDEPERPEVDA